MPYWKSNNAYYCHTLQQPGSGGCTRNAQVNRIIGNLFPCNSRSSSLILHLARVFNFTCGNCSRCGNALAAYTTPSDIEIGYKPLYYHNQVSLRFTLITLCDRQKGIFWTPFQSNDFLVYEIKSFRAPRILFVKNETFHHSIVQFCANFGTGYMAWAPTFDRLLRWELLARNSG